MHVAPVESQPGPITEGIEYDPQTQLTRVDPQMGYTTTCFRISAETYKNEADRVMDD